MRIFTAIGVSLFMFVSGAHSQNPNDEGAIRIMRSGSQPSRQAPAENFTGSVRVDPLFQAIAPARASGFLVTFEPGARTAWHTHTLGQILIVTAGTGRVQRWGDSVEEIRQGDVVWIPPGQKHWHGAAPQQFDGTHRHRGTNRWEDCRLDGEGQRRAVQRAGPSAGGRHGRRREAPAIAGTNR